MPPKKHRGFRFSEAACQALETYSQKWSCSPTEALEHLLIRWRYLDNVGFSQFQETLSDEIACTLRIQQKGLFYCMHGVPQNVKLDRRLIETFDICRVCRRRKLGLTESSISVRSEAQTISEQSPSCEESSLGPDRSSSFKQDPRIRGNIYCPDGGFWVFAAKCEMCKRGTYERWNDCKTKPNAPKEEFHA